MVNIDIATVPQIIHRRQRALNSAINAIPIINIMLEYPTGKCNWLNVDQWKRIGSSPENAKSPETVKFVCVIQVKSVPFDTFLDWGGWLDYGI